MVGIDHPNSWQASRKASVWRDEKRRERKKEEAIDVKKGRKNEERSTEPATGGKKGGANVKKERKRNEKTFGVWCDNTKHWVSQVPFNYQIAI